MLGTRGGFLGLAAWLAERLTWPLHGAGGWVAVPLRDVACQNEDMSWVVDRDALEEALNGLTSWLEASGEYCPRGDALSETLMEIARTRKHRDLHYAETQIEQARQASEALLSAPKQGQGACAQVEDLEARFLR